MVKNHNVKGARCTGCTVFKLTMIKFCTAFRQNIYFSVNCELCTLNQAHVHAVGVRDRELPELQLRVWISRCVCRPSPGVDPGVSFR